MFEFQFEGFCDYCFESMPRGEVLRLAVNPYNGKVVVQFLDGHGYDEVASRVIEELAWHMSAYGGSGVRSPLGEFADTCETLSRNRDISLIGLDGGGVGASGCRYRGCECR